MTTAKTKARRIEYARIDELIPADRNPKLHDDDGIAASITEFGMVEPVVIDERTGKLVVGHGRWHNLLALAEGDGPPPEGIEVARNGGWMVPVVRGWSSTDDEHAAAYLIASNYLTTKGGWDDRGLATLLEELDTDLLPITGFSAGDLDSLLANLEAATPPPVDDPEDPDDMTEPEHPVTVRGDVWILGPHRVMCGDCRVDDDLEMLLRDARVNLAFTSPPYADRREYDGSSGFKPIPPEHYVKWFEAVAAGVADYLVDDGSWCINIKAGAHDLDRELYVLDLITTHVREWGWHFADEFCWERNGVPKHVILRLKNQFEMVYQLTRGRWKFRPDSVRHATDNAIMSLGSGDTVWTDKQGHGGVIDPKRKARKRGATGDLAGWQGLNAAPGEATGVGLAYPGNRLPTFSGSHEATGHNAAFPVGLPAFFIRLMTDEGDVVFDPFLGSGSTLLAAHQWGRVSFGMELSPGYVDIICRRWQRHTGITPILEATGEEHDFTPPED